MPLPQSNFILDEAAQLIATDRNQTYGHPLFDFSKTAQMLTGLLRDKLKPDARIDALDVPLIVICVKLSREMNRHKVDNPVDIAGYAGTIGMLVDRLTLLINDWHKDKCSLRYEDMALAKRLEIWTEKDEAKWKSTN